MSQPQPAAPGASPGQAPMGVSSATGPTPNKGYEAAGLQKLGMVVQQMQELIPLLGATSEPGAAVLKALGALAKHVPPGSVTPAAQRNMAENTMMRATQANQQMQALKQGGQPPQQGAPPAGMAA